jgi:hypothetical protein
MTDPQVLISRYFAGGFCSEDIAELRAWILSDPANALEYARASFVHNALYQTLSGGGRLQDMQNLEHVGLDDTIVGVKFEDAASAHASQLPSASELTPGDEAAEAVEFPARGTSGVENTKVSRNRLPWRVAAAVLVPLLLAIGAWGLIHARASSAILVASVDSQWGLASAQPATGVGLPTEALYLKAGLVKVRFTSGAETIIEGPARFRVRSNNGLDLDAGRVTALVPAPAHGFTIRTPSATAVDLGTEFGVVVSGDGSTHIEVFRGNVEARSLKASADAAGAPQILTAGEASDVAAGATMVSAARATPGQFVRQDEFDARAAANEGSSYQRWLAYSYQLRRDPNLVAYYTFDNAIGNPDRLLNRSSLGNALDGVLGEDDPQAKPTWTTGRWAKKGALAFDPVHYSHVIVHSGVGDPLDFSRGVQTASPFTIAAWIRVDVQPDDDAAIIAKGLVGAEQFGIDTGASLKLQDWIRDTAASRQVAGVQIFGDPIALGSWVMLVATYDPAQRITRLYVNGQLDAHSDGVPQKLVSTDQPVTIGARRDTKSDDGSFTYVQPFEGLMDELAIFRQSISAERVMEMYQAGKPD